MRCCAAATLGRGRYVGVDIARGSLDDAADRVREMGIGAGAGGGGGGTSVVPLPHPTPPLVIGPRRPP